MIHGVCVLTCKHECVMFTARNLSHRDAKQCSDDAWFGQLSPARRGRVFAYHQLAIVSKSRRINVNVLCFTSILL